MTKFLDGPAAGQRLSLRRAPIFLRAVEYRGKWDALNELDDQAKPHERIHLYILSEPATGMFIRCQPRSHGGFFAMAIYRHVPDAPDDATLRDNAKWVAWVEANMCRLMPGWAKEKKEKSCAT